MRKSSGAEAPPVLLGPERVGQHAQREQPRVAREPRADVIGPVVPAARPAGVALQRLDEGLRPVHAVLVDPRRPGERRGALDPVGEADRPLVRLLRAHRPAEHERELLHAEVLAQQALLGDDVVTDPHPGEVALPVRPREVVR